VKRILRDILGRWLSERRFDALQVGIAALLGLAAGVAWMILIALKGGR